MGPQFGKNFAGRKTLDLMLSEVDQAEGLEEADSS